MRRASRAAEQPSEKSTCHPERRMRASVVEAVGRERSEPSKRRGATATKGSRNEFGWLSIGNVTFPMNGYREIVRRSCSMLRISHFCLFGASHPQPAKVRLRASPFAQDDGGVVLLHSHEVREQPSHVCAGRIHFTREAYFTHLCISQIPQGIYFTARSAPRSSLKILAFFRASARAPCE